MRCTILPVRRCNQKSLICSQFLGQKAVDTLVESKKYGSNAPNPKFQQRQQAVSFLKDLLDRGLFFRARVLVPKKKTARPEAPPSVRPTQTTEEANTEGEKAEEATTEQPAKKKKIKLVIHDNQILNDDSDVYVWVFDPTPLYKKIIGILIRKL
jgi:hypothetical protein